MTATTAGAMRVRVTVADAWKTVSLDATAAESATSLKTRALASAQIDASRASRYALKVGGALVRDESRPLAGLGVRNGTSLVVITGRRRPVR